MNTQNKQFSKLVVYYIKSVSEARVNNKVIFLIIIFFKIAFGTDSSFKESKNFQTLW